MKIFKFFLLVSAVIAISCFSWNYYINRSHKGKYEKATLVFEECYNSAEVSDLERLSCM